MKIIRVWDTKTGKGKKCEVDSEYFPLYQPLVDNMKHVPTKRYVSFIDIPKYDCHLLRYTNKPLRTSDTTSQFVCIEISLNEQERNRINYWKRYIMV